MIDLTFDSTNNKVINIYKGNNNRFQGVIGTISGTAISWGTPVDVNTSTDNRFPSGSFDTNAGKIFIAYKDSATDYVLGVVGTVSGTSISFGTAVTLASVGVNGEVSAAYNPDTQNHKVIYGSLVSPFPIRQFTATVSGTSVSASGDRAVTSDQGQVYQSGLTYDTNTNQFVSASRTTSSEVGGGLVYVSPAGASNTDFIGITDQAIADTATGAVIVQGGVSSSVAAPYLTNSVGADSVFESANTRFISLKYDSSNQKIVISYSDVGNSYYGNVVVGTVSGDSISFGTPVIYSSSTTYQQNLQYDSNAQKIVVAYRNAGASNAGTALVGTVSGTSVSFGSPVVFHSGGIVYMSAGFDTTNNKLVVAYSDNANSNYGAAIVGTVSGTSISFGSSTVLAASTLILYPESIAFDSDNSKVVICRRDTADSNYGKAIVGTISGTSISFGSDTTFNANVTYEISTAYDSNENKIVVAYRNNLTNCLAKVGTVSGTSISFGGAGTISATDAVATIVFDTNINKIICAFHYSTIQGAVGEVSGTNITFGPATELADGSISEAVSTYDAANSKMVIAYKDSTNSSYGTANVVNAGDDLTIGSDYYVQDDGTLSTTASSVPAGRALSSTSILLEG
jgi:hypothetical protein